MTRDRLESAILELPSEYRTLITREIASVLLAASEEWRDRRVESIAPLDENHYRDRISIQFTLSPRHIWKAIDGAARRIRDAQNRADDGASNPVRDYLPSLYALADSEESASAWEAENISVVVPILTLPKRILLNADVEDGDGKRLPLYNRFANSEFATYHVHTRYLEVAERALDRADLNIERLLPLLRAMTFSMPEGLLHPSNFRRHRILGAKWVKRRTASRRIDRHPEKVVGPMKSFIERTGATFDDGLAASTLGLMTKGARISDLLSQLAWAQPNGLRDALTNPLLLFPDYVKVLGDRAHLDIDAELRSFMLKADEFLTLLEILAKDSRTATRYGPLEGLSRFAHSWVAFAPLSVCIGRPSLVKVTQTIQVGQREDSPRTTRSYLWLKAHVVPLRGVHHTYRLNVEDGRGTHVEIVSPDPAAVRLVARRTRVDIGESRFRGRRLRQLFGIDYSRSPDLQAFYTTKNRSEIDRLLDQPKGFLRRMWVRISRKDRSSAKSREVANVRVVYKLRIAVAGLYLIGTALSLFVAWFIWKDWHTILMPVERVPKARQLTYAKQFGFLTAFTTVFTGLLAARERASVAAGNLVRLRAMLFGSLIAILIGFALALVNGHLRAA